MPPPPCVAQDYLDDLQGNARQPTQSRSTFKLDVYFQARGSGADASVFSPANLDRIRLVQQRVVSGANYDEYCFMEPGTSECAEPRSPLTALGAAATHEEIQAKLREQVTPGATPALDKDFECVTPRARVWQLRELCPGGCCAPLSALYACLAIA